MTIHSEYMSPDLIDLLLDTLDFIDKNTDPSQSTKRLILSTLGFDRMGDKSPITPENVEAWTNLRDEYFKAQRHDYLSESIRILLENATFDLITRCFTSKNANTLFEKLSLGWKI